MKLLLLFWYRFHFLQKLNLVNGVLFTGGWAKTGLYYETVQELFKVHNWLLQLSASFIQINAHYSEL